MGNANSGLKEYQEKQRKATLDVIADTITRMRQNHININYTTLSEESGLCRKTLQKPYVRAFLLNYREFCRDIQVDPSADELQKAIALKDKKAEDLRTRCKKAEADLQLLRAKYDELKKKYQRLLARYQIDVENKIIKI